MLILACIAPVENTSNNIYPCVLTMLPYMACYLETVLINWHSTNWRPLHRQQYLPLCSDHALTRHIIWRHYPSVGNPHPEVQKTILFVFHRQQYLPLCSDHALLHGILFGDTTHQLVIPPRGSENKFLFLETPEHSMVLRYRIELGQLYTPPYLVVRLKCCT